MSRHLSPASCLDLAEGHGDAAALRHAGSCAACQAEVMALRSALQQVAAVDVPEPSPLFWDHLSARVREAVAAEPPARARWSVAWGWTCGTVTVMVALLVSSVVLTTRSPEPAPVAVAAVGDPLVVAAGDDEASLALIVDLAGAFDWDDVAASGLTASRASVDDVVGELTGAERQELQRLLTQALEAGERAL